MIFMSITHALTLSLPRGLPLALDRVKSIGFRQRKIYEVILGLERVKGDSFLTLSLPRGLPLTSKNVRRLRQSKIY